MPESLPCPLCREPASEFYADSRRAYFRCSNCRLISADPATHLSAEAERAHYDTHENDPSDQRYRAFLNRLAEPLIARLPTGAVGLDFGCGPGPTLSVMCEEAGFPTAIYDPFYFDDRTVLERPYDFITATEVVEHLHSPRAELWRLWEMLRPGGWLGIMTSHVPDLETFSSWYYTKDPTHVVFFALETFQWLAEQWQAELIHPSPNVVLLQKCLAAAPC